MSSFSDTSSDGKMLKPFTIRRLSGVVQIGSEEYNHTVKRNPDAALTYCDEDDGEKITVGSAFELRQRLDEPGTSVFKLRGEPLHIFDIRRASKAGTTWTDFRDRTRERAMASVVASGENLIIANNGPGESHHRSFESSIRVSKASISEQERMDERTSWLRACQPPQAAASRSSVSSQIPYTSADTQTNTCVLNNTNPSLTEEGQRQAREAGAKFNWRPSIRSRTSNDPSIFFETAENRWASYSTGSETPKLTASSCMQETRKEKTLLESFEEELAKIAYDSAAGKENAAQEQDNAAASREQPQESTQEDHQSRAEAAATDLAGPGAIVFDIVSALAGGLQVLGDELTKKLPDIEQGIAKAQRDIPQAFNDAVSDAIRGVGNIPHVAGNTGNRHSRDIEDTANHLHDSAFEAAEGLLSGFGQLIGSIGEVGKILLQDQSASTRDEESSARGKPQQHGSPVEKPSNDPTKSGNSPPDSVSTEAHVNPLGDVRSTCRDDCVIGQSRTYVNCVVRDLYSPNRSLSRKVTGPATTGSHFRSRETEKAYEANRRARSRSPILSSHQSASQDVSDLFAPEGSVLAKDSQVETVVDPLKRSRSRIFDHTPNINVQKENHYSSPKEPQPSSSSVKQSGTILDQDDTSLEFSARYPSLVSSPPCHPAKTVRFGNGGSDSFLNNLNPESEIARFPTLSQLNRPGTSNHPASERCSLGAETSAKTIVPPSEPTPLNKIPGSWPQQETDLPPPAEQSSGQFFERMTGRSAPNETLDRHNNLFRSKSITALNPAARLPGPFDPLSDLAHTMREQDRRNRNLRRAGTERVPTALRRPYSERFTGAGRVPWDNFLQSSGARAPHRQERRDLRFGTRDLMRPRSLYDLNTSSRPTLFGQHPGRQPLENAVKSTEPQGQVKNPFPQRQLPVGQSSHPSRQPNSQSRLQSQVTAYTPLSPLDTRVPQSGAVPPRVPAPQPKDKIDLCVDRLRDMGYGQRDTVEMERLRVFAIAADGNVEEAVTVLEEEREAGRGRGWLDTEMR